MTGHSDPAAGTAVTWLFVPGDRPDRFDRATASGADATICDLEDAIDPAAKDVARDNVVRWLNTGGRAWVRPNGPSTVWHAQDVAALRDAPGLLGVLVPKAEDPRQLLAMAGELRAVELVALIETAVGVVRAEAIAGCPVVGRLAFGSVDFAADINAEGGPESLLLARSTLVLASRGAGKPPPIDGITTAIRDEAAVLAAARYARSLGFGGKLCVHPAQVAPTALAFEPSGVEMLWARTVLDAASASGLGVATVDGQMIDKPVIERARRILAAGASRRAGTVGTPR